MSGVCVLGVCRPSPWCRVFGAGREGGAARCALYAGGSAGRVVGAYRAGCLIVPVGREGRLAGERGAAGSPGDLAGGGSGGHPSGSRRHGFQGRDTTIDLSANADA